MSDNRASAPAVELLDVGVYFRIPTERVPSFKEYVLRRVTSRIEYRDLWALKALNVTIPFRILQRASPKNGPCGILYTLIHSADTS